MRSRSSGAPAFPFRKWNGRDGSEMLALHPLWLALKKHHDALAGRKTTLHEFKRLVSEYASGERQIPDAVQAEAREVDALQRENGYEGP